MHSKNTRTPLLHLAALCLPHNEERTAEDLAEFWDSHVPDGLDLVALPMQCITRGESEGSLALFSRLASQARVHLVANVDIAAGDGVSNVSILYAPDGGEVGRYVKTHQLPYENFRLGDKLPIFETPIGKVGMIAGTDHYFPEIMEVMALKDVDIIVWSQAPETLRDTYLTELKMRARATDDNTFIVCSDYGPTVEYMPSYLVFHRLGQPTGRSYVINPLGDLVGATGYEPGIAVACVRPRHKRNVWHNIRGISPQPKAGVFAPICSLPPGEEAPLPQRPIRIAMACTCRARRLYQENGLPSDSLDFEYLFDMASQAAAADVDLVALGEYFYKDIPSYPQRLAALAARHNCYISTAGFGAEAPYYGFLFGRNGETVGRYDVVTDGATEFPVFDTDIGRIAMTVCRDTKQQELDRIYGLQCADIILWVTMASGPSGELLTLKHQGRAIDNGAYIVTSDHVISDPGLRNTVIDPYGYVLHASQYMREGIDVFSFVMEKQGWFDPEDLVPGFMTDWDERPQDVPRLVPAFKKNFRQVWLSCRRPELYEPIVSHDRSAHEHNRDY